MKSIKFCAILALMFLGVSTQAQISESTQADSAKITKKVKDKRPVRAPFQSGTLINQQTTENLKKKELEVMIEHRFGTFQNGYQDLLGVYGSANIRIGFDYGIIDRVQLGFGVTKNNLTTDFRGKVMIFKQTRTNSMPVAISYFGDMGIAGSKDTVQFKKAVDRLSFFHQIIISRRFCDYFSLQVAGSYMHYNIVAAAAGTKHDNFAISGGARFKISPQSSILIEFDYPFTNTGSLEHSFDANKSYPNIGLAWEIATTGHAFQIVICSASGILPQADIVYNSNDIATPKKGLVIGFNITRIWSFAGKGK